MRKSLIALATVGVLASGAAAADSYTVRVGEHDGPFVHHGAELRQRFPGLV